MPKLAPLLVAAGLASLALSEPARARDPGPATLHPPPGPAGLEYRACLPARLHPVSRAILEAYLDGRLSREYFRWGFHLPNSDYLPVAECVLRSLGEFTET